MGVASKNSTLPCAITTSPEYRCLSLLLAMSGRVYHFFSPRGHEPSPSVTASTHTSAFNAIAFQSPVMPNARMWRSFNSLVYKNRLHGRRGKGTAEFFSRQKLNKHRRRKVEKSCVTLLCDLAGTPRNLTSRINGMTTHIINRAGAGC